MVRKQHVPPESDETVCSACGAAIKAPPSARRRRVQCPKCREVVFIESSPGKQPEAPPEPAPAAAAAVDQRHRIELLEARVELLEAALRDSMAVGRSAAVSGTNSRRLLWLTSEPGQAPEFSPEQGRVLFHNLGSVRSQAITIRTPIGDPGARAHAEWFKSVFERAGWTVRGPDEIAPDAAPAGLSLAVPELPVAKEAAATFFALKAAGFAPTPVLDSALADETGAGTPAMSLTVPPEKAA
jgi:hypothetical protein